MKNDTITDQSLTVLECRALVDAIFSGVYLVIPRSSEHYATLKNLERKAIRGAAVEIPSETLRRRRSLGETTLEILRDLESNI